MSEPAIPDRPFYVTGGTLKPGEPSYVERRADTELYESILAGEFCYVLTARQMGKSSLMARTAKRLEQAGVASAIVDLTQIGSERGDQAAAQWYFGIANVIHRQLGITVPLRPWWQERSDLSSVQRLTDFFREVVLANVPGRIVIFVDEIDSTIGLPFADDFFAALRACFNARATDDAFERLTFVLLGVATPDQLIRDQTRTPFNIGKRIDLTDFSLDEAQVLAPGLHPDAGEAGKRLERVLHWTGGHPYLTQALCRAVREKADTGTAEEVVDPQVEELFLTSRAQREETNLKHARARLERGGSEGRRLLKLYRRVRQGKTVQDQPTSPLCAQLKLVGVVKATDEGCLAVRNRIYEAVFTSKWAKSAMPADRSMQLAAAMLAVSLSFLAWYAPFQPRPYEEELRAAIEKGNYVGALEAYTALRLNPFSRSRATVLMQQFWEQRALRYAQIGKRDESILSYLQGLKLEDSKRLRRRVRNLLGADYERLRLTLRHKEEVRTVAFAPDGRTLATVSWDKAARLWDIHSGRLCAPPLHHQSHIHGVAFSSDGQTITTGFSEGLVQLWETRSGKPLGNPLQLQRPFGEIAFSSDGRLAVTGRPYDKTAQLWDSRTGRPLGPPLKHQGMVVAVAFSDNGRLVATGSEDKTARIWDVRTGRPLTPSLRHQDGVYALAFSPDGRSVATGSGDFTARLWDVRSGTPITVPLWHESIVDGVTFSPDGRILATGSSDETAWLWDARTGKPLAPPFQHQDDVATVAYSPDGGTVATGSADTTVRLWDARSDKPFASTLSYKDFVYLAAFSPDGKIFATSSYDHIVRLWDARTGKPLTPPLKHQEVFAAVAFSADSRRVATATDDGAVQLWDVRTGKALAPPLRHQTDSSTYQIVFSPVGATVATASSDDTVGLWDARTGMPLVPPLQHEESVVAVAFSPDGRTVVTAAADNTIRLWDARTGKSLTPPLRHQNTAYIVTFSPDGRILATGSDDEVGLWDARSGRPLVSPWRIQGRIKTIGFRPRGRDFFVATDHWLNTYSWGGEKIVHKNSQWLDGTWKQWFRFPSGCGNCLQVALGYTASSFRIETLHLDEPTSPPIEGDPKELLEKWQARLGLKFDEQMRPVPR